MKQKAPKKLSRWEVHQAIEVALEGVDGAGFIEALRTIICFGSTLPKQSVEIARVFPGKKHDSVQGHAEGIGDVEIQKDDPKKPRTWIYGAEKERIGHYRMRRVSDTEIDFHHYWASEAGTSASEEGVAPIGACYIQYGWKTHEPLAFGRIHFWQPLPFLKSRGVNIWLTRYEPLWTNPTRRIWTGLPDAFVGSLLSLTGALLKMRSGTSEAWSSGLFFMSVALFFAGLLWIGRCPIAKHMNR